jgi:hypothetical protein
LILDFEFDQHLGSHKHVINIIMWFRDMGCYRASIGSVCKAAGTLLYCWWNVWKERNKQVFDTVQRFEMQVASATKDEIDLFFRAFNI